MQISHVLDWKISASDAMIINDYAGVALEKVNYNRDQQKRYYFGQKK